MGMQRCFSARKSIVHSLSTLLYLVFGQDLIGAQRVGSRLVTL
jgi:hypothetical protein